MFYNFRMFMIETFIENKRNLFILVSITVLSAVILLVCLFQQLNKENPKYTFYTGDSCNDWVGLNQLAADKKLKVLTTTRIKKEVGIFSVLMDGASSYSRVVDIINESNNLIQLANQTDADQKRKSITIPKQACYISANNAQYSFGAVSQLPNTNFEIYQWTKHYRTSLSDKEYTERNTVVIINNHSIQFILSMAPSVFLPKLSSQVVMYNLA